jgi:MFS family permease
VTSKPQGIETALAAFAAVVLANVVTTLVDPWGGTRDWAVALLRAVRFASSVAVPLGVLAARDERPLRARLIETALAALATACLLEVVVAHGDKDLVNLQASALLATVARFFDTLSSAALVVGTFAAFALAIPRRSRWFAGLCLEAPLVLGWTLRRALDHPGDDWDSWRPYAQFYVTMLLSVGASFPLFLRALAEVKQRLAPESD